MARNEELLSQTKKEILESSPEVKVDYFICDTKDNEQVKKTVQNVEKAFSKIDILVNCAAALPEESTLENFEDKKLFEQIEVKVDLGLKLPEFAKPVRVILTGSLSSPSIDKTMFLLGKKSCIQRIGVARSLVTWL